MAALLTALLLVFSSVCVFSYLVYGFLSLFARPPANKEDFDAIDCRNEVRYLRYHYPEDKP